MLSTLKQPSRFEYNWQALWLQPQKCAVCTNEFVLRSKTPRWPLLMTCNHAVCDRCCYGMKPIALKCNHCSGVTQIGKHQAICEALETNFYLLGILSYQEFNMKHDINVINSHSPNEKRVDHGKLSLQECSECTDVLTNYFCVQCSVPYCKNCFDLVHQDDKALQKHHLSQLDDHGKKSIHFEERRCRCHCNFIAKYCPQCRQAMCSVCVMDGTKRRELSSIADENQKSLSHVASLIKTVHAARESIKIAQKEARFIAKRYEDYALETIKEISSYFIHLHGVMQNAERQALLQVKDGTLKLTVKLQQSQSSLKKGQETFDEILGSLEETMSNPPINFTIDKLVEKTNFFLETTPCNIEFEGVNNNPFEFKRIKKEPVDFPDLYELRMHTSALMPRIHTCFRDINRHGCSNESRINRSYPKPAMSQRNAGAARPQQSIPASLKIKPRKMKKRGKAKQPQSKPKALFGRPAPDRWFPL